MEMLKIRSAHTKDCKEIYNLLTPYIGEGLLLPRNEEDIQGSINNFLIAELDDQCIGCVAVKNYSNGLFEIRSLAVKKSFTGNGFGSLLVINTVNHIKKNFSAWRIFALTRRPNVFIRAGFKIVSKDLFPEKVWNDCSNCARLHNCDEVAMQFTL